jgi:hypothetical protein
MAIEDEIKALKALVAKIIPEKPAGVVQPYNPATSNEWKRRKRLAKQMFAILRRDRHI